MNSNTKLCNFAKIFVTVSAFVYNVINIAVTIDAIRMSCPQYYAHEVVKLLGKVISVCWLPLVISVFIVILFYIIFNFFCDIEVIAENTRFHRNY